MTCPRCRLLLDTAREEGLTLWARWCVETAPEVRSTIDLRQWADFLYDALRTPADLHTSWVCREEGVDPLWGAYRLALPLLSPLAPLGAGPALERWVGRLCLASFRKPSRQEDRGSCGYRPLVRTLWDQMRRLGRSAVHRWVPFPSGCESGGMT